MNDEDPDDGAAADDRNSMTLESSSFKGKTYVNAGEAGTDFYVETIEGETFLNGSDNDDTFNIASGLTAGIAQDLFLAGNGGNDSLFVDDSSSTGLTLRAALFAKASIILMQAVTAAPLIVFADS